MIDGSTDDNMKMLESSDSFILGPNLEHLILTGSANITGTGNNLDNIIEGNSGNNMLDGKEGFDILTGHEGADTFVFSHPTSFGDSLADAITDFNPRQGDRIQISKNAFGISGNPLATLSVVTSESELTAALLTDNLFVYHSTRGFLYWNQNGNGVGFGSGGVFAVLDSSPIPSLNAGNLVLT